MLHETYWTDAELAELRRLIAHEWAETRNEFHHTSSYDYRQKIKNHMELLSAVMQKLQTASPIESPAS